MNNKGSSAKRAASFWLEAPVQRKQTGEGTLPDKTPAIRPGFLLHARMLTMREDLKRKFFALDRIREMRSSIADRLCRESASKDEAVVRLLRNEAVLVLAEFYYAIHILGLMGPDDSLVLLDLHNARAAAMAKHEGRALDARFTDRELLQFEEIWRACPGSLEEAMLARFLAHAMPNECVEPLVTACEAAGFVLRENVGHVRIVASTGVLEAVVTDCLAEIKLGKEYL